jgi:hypothetical protein
VASEVMLLSTGDWTEVYIDGLDFIGNHSLSNYEWALVVKKAQGKIESISEREFVHKDDSEYWPYNNAWPEALKDIPESELGAIEVLMEPQAVNGPSEIA